jgi:hypothetical protein
MPAEIIAKIGYDYLTLEEVRNLSHTSRALRTLSESIALPNYGQTFPKNYSDIQNAMHRFRDLARPFSNTAKTSDNGQPAYQIQPSLVALDGNKLAVHGFTPNGHQGEVKIIDANNKIQNSILRDIKSVAYINENLLLYQQKKDQHLPGRVANVWTWDYLKNGYRHITSIRSHDNFDADESVSSTSHHRYFTVDRTAVFYRTSPTKWSKLYSHEDHDYLMEDQLKEIPITLKKSNLADDDCDFTFTVLYDKRTRQYTFIYSNDRVVNNMQVAYPSLGPETSYQGFKFAVTKVDTNSFVLTSTSAKFQMQWLFDGKKKTLEKVGG